MALVETNFDLQTDKCNARKALAKMKKLESKQKRMYSKRMDDKTILSASSKEHLNYIVEQYNKRK